MIFLHFTLNEIVTAKTFNILKTCFNKSHYCTHINTPGASTNILHYFVFKYTASEVAHRIEVD